MSIILRPFAWLIVFFYNLANSYGLALILFAIVIKMILFPVTLKSKKSMIQMNMLSAQTQKLQKQYGKDQARYNMELQKLYEREHVNPMGGCLWSMIPVIVLLALYGIIRYPLTHFMGLTVEQIQVIAAQLDWQHVAVANGWVTESAMTKLVEQVANGEIASVFQNTGFYQIYLTSLIDSANLPALQAALGEAGKNLFVINFSFLGLNLNEIPNWQFWAGGFSWNSIGLFLMAILSAVVSFISMKVSLATNQMNQGKKDGAGNEAMDRTNKMMNWMMPLMSLWIGFTLPAAMCVYWITQYLVNMIQEVICGQLLKKDYEAARAAAAKREQDEKEEEKRRKEEARKERERRIEEEKKNRGKKKPAKKGEPTPPGINKDDSKVGIRAYARGRAYDPNRFGGVTPYRDPNTGLTGKNEEKKDDLFLPEEEDKPELPAVEETTAIPAETAPVETEEIEVEVEEIEVEADENE